jgi:cytochrome c6
MPPALPSRFIVGRSAAIVASAAAVALFAGCGSSSDSSGSSTSNSGGSSSSSSSGTKLITTASTGKAIFQGAGCVSCHTLADAGSNGNIGPNLDQSKPSEAEAVDKVTNGSGSMPSFQGRLSAAQIKTVAEYVHQVTAK